MKKAETRAYAPSVQPLSIQLGTSSLLIFVWIATLLVSQLPAILINEFHIATSFSVLSMRIVLLAALIALSFVWSIARPLRAYFIIFLALYAVNAFFDWVGTQPFWQSWFGGAAASFSRDMMGSQLLRLGVALIMVIVMLVMRYRRSEFFLVKGDLNAVAEPVRWIGMDRPAGWTRFGLILASCITLGTLAFLILSSRPSGDVLAQVIPLLPVILIASAMNAFSEEMTFRAALLAPLHGVVGKSQALLLTAMLFGLWHYYGVPYGVIGVIMSGALGWLIGKSMLETKGMFWPWFIHFWQDVAIFAFIAAGSVTPGG